MLTMRASMVIGVSTLFTCFALLGRLEGLALVSLSIVIWVLVEWFLFRGMVLISQNGWTKCGRKIASQADDRITLVTDRNIEVKITGRLPWGVSGYRFLIQDTVPDTFRIFHGKSNLLVDAGGSEEFELNYSIRTSVCGKAEFPGLRIEITDHCGLFRTEQFVPIPQKSTVLPFLIRPQTTVSVLKRNNLQQHMGHHRNLTCGVSSELLGIRDYRVGDPPRTIAWKPTARLGKLMTCEFENEVPIRATMIVDLASYQFQGRPGPSAADRAITTAASIARLLLADRDPVGAVLVTSSTTRRVKHGGGERQLVKLLQHLMDASNPNPPLHKYSIDLLVEVVFDNAYRRFPQLFNDLFNTGPIRSTLFRIGSARKRRIRGALAIALEHLLNFDPGWAARMQFDDHWMGTACLLYVDRYSVVGNSTTISLETPGYNPAKWRLERQKVTQSLCEQITEVRSRARDNELLVIVTPEPIDQIGIAVMENSIRTSIAAGHRVIFVAPQPPKLDHAISDPIASRIVRNSDGSDARNADSEFRDKMVALGAAFSRIDNPGLMQLVAMEIGLLQSAKSRARGIRRR